MARGTSIIVPLLLTLLAVSALAQQQTRRLRVRTRPLPVQQEEPELEAEARSAQGPPQVQYYAVQPQEEEVEQPQALVLVQQPRGRVSNPAAYNGLYGNQLARADEEYRPQQASRAPLARATSAQSPRTKESRPPPVQTIRNFNTINDDGSFTFGYEAADGSFKEETRGIDCVVRGKYGYVDPDGNKREFTYVSGNPCDPNNPDPEEDERELEEDSGEENIPVQRPRPRPVQAVRTRPHIPTTNTPSTAVFQNNYHHSSQRIKAADQIPITPRPVLRQQTTLVEPPPTTYRPQIQNYPAVTTPRPQQQQAFYTSSPVQATPTRRPIQHIQHTTPNSIDFEAELKKFALEAGSPTLRPATPAVKARPTTQNLIQPTQFAPRPQQQTAQRLAPTQQQPGTNPYYSSQLVFDPSTGQYNNVLYQQIPKGGGDFQSSHRLQPYVHQQPQHQQAQHQQLQHHQQQQQQLFTPQRGFPLPPLNSQNPAVNYQQQAPVATPTPAHYQPQQYSRPAAPPNSAPQSFYYINPNLRNQYSTGQIDSFLRGHNLQF